MGHSQFFNYHHQWWPSLSGYNQERDFECPLSVTRTRISRSIILSGKSVTQSMTQRAISSGDKAENVAQDLQAECRAVNRQCVDGATLRRALRVS